MKQISNSPTTGLQRKALAESAKIDFVQQYIIMEVLVQYFAGEVPIPTIVAPRYYPLRADNSVRVYADNYEFIPEQPDPARTVMGEYDYLIMALTSGKITLPQLQAQVITRADALNRFTE